ncbi:interleukin-10 receptor subunit beta-like [Rhinophrynus dorsalis]
MAGVRITQRRIKNNYNDVCHTDVPYCDFSLLSYNSSVRVRAELNGSTSEWVYLTFDPYSQTVITAPEVKIAARAGNLDISFSGPKQEDNRHLKDKYGRFLYRVFYWKESKPQEVSIMNTTKSFEVLDKLEKWTTYCLKVQAYAPDDDNVGEFSPVLCETITDNGIIPGWKIAITFILSMCISTGTTIGLFYLGHVIYKATKYVFFPNYSFPQHLKEYLNKPFYSMPNLPTQSNEDCTESCEKLTFVSEENEESDGKDRLEIQTCRELYPIAD